MRVSLCAINRLVEPARSRYGPGDRTFVAEHIADGLTDSGGVDHQLGTTRHAVQRGPDGCDHGRVRRVDRKSPDVADLENFDLHAAAWKYPKGWKFAMQASISAESKA